MSQASYHLDQLLRCNSFTKNDWEKVYRIIYAIGKRIHFPDDIAKYCTRLVDLIVIYYTDNLDLINFIKIPRLLDIEEKLLYELSKAYNIREDEAYANCDININVDTVTRLHRTWHSLPFSNQRSFLSDLIHFAFSYSLLQNRKSDNYALDKNVKTIDKVDSINAATQADDNFNIEYVKQIKPLLESCVDVIVDPLHFKINKTIKSLRQSIKVDRNLLKSSTLCVTRFKKHCLKSISSRITILEKLLTDNTTRRDQQLQQYVTEKIETLEKLQNESMHIDELRSYNKDKNDYDDDDDNTKGISLLTTKVNYLCENIAGFLEQHENDRKQCNHDQIIENMALVATATPVSEKTDNQDIFASSFLQDNRLRQQSNYEQIFTYVTKRLQTKTSEVKNREILRSELCKYFFAIINNDDVIISNYEVLITVDTVNYYVQSLIEESDADSLLCKYRDREYSLQVENFKLKETIITLEEQLQSVVNINEEYRVQIENIMKNHEVEVRKYLCQINELNDSINNRTQKETAVEISNGELSECQSNILNFENKVKALNEQLDNVKDQLSSVKDRESISAQKVSKLENENKHLQAALRNQRFTAKALKRDLTKVRLRLDNSQKSLHTIQKLQQLSCERTSTMLSKSRDVNQKLHDKIKKYRDRNEKVLKNKTFPLPMLKSQKLKTLERRKSLNKDSFIKTGIPLLIDNKEEYSGSEKDIAIQTIDVIENEFKKHLRLINKRNAQNDLAASIYANNKDVMQSVLSHFEPLAINQVNWKTVILFLAGKLNWEFPNLSFQKFMNNERNKLSKVFKRKQNTTNNVSDVI